MTQRDALLQAGRARGVLQQRDVVLAGGGRRRLDISPFDWVSSLRAFINSSEPVLDRSHQAFLARFGSRGARPDQLTASYAMAENVYAVTQSLPGGLRVLAARRRPFLDEHRVEEAAPGEDALPFVRNGRCVPGTELRIVDAAGDPLPDGRAGEIVIRGQFRFEGYFRRDDLTAAALLPGGWYRSGDLGFIVGDEVYVTGRKKDLIIVQGKNVYPTDVEESVAQVPGVTAGRVVAFGVEDERAGTEGLVVLFEPSDDAPADAMAVAKAIRAPGGAGPRPHSRRCADGAATLAGEVDLGEARARRQPREVSARAAGLIGLGGPRAMFLVP